MAFLLKLSSTDILHIPSFGGIYLIFGSNFFFTIALEFLSIFIILPSSDTKAPAPVPAQVPAPL